MCAQSCPTLCTPWTAAHQAPLSIGFPKQEYWSGLPFPSPEDLPDPRIEPAFPSWQLSSLPLSPDSKESACSAGDPGSIPESGRSPGKGNSYPLQYSCLENSTDRGARQAMVHQILKSQTWRTNWHFISFHFNSSWDLFLIAVSMKKYFSLSIYCLFFLSFFSFRLRQESWT